MRVLEDGPWMFGKDLVAVADFDGEKTIDEVEFTFIPVWVRVMKMSLGLMNKAAGEMISDVLEVDVDDDDMAVGKYMRVKVKLDIHKLFMRGVTMDVGGDPKEKMKWCPLVYKYLLDFCYTCGLIGHTNHLCEVQLQKGEAQQFSRALRFIPEKKFREDCRSKSGEQRYQLPWRSSRGREVGGSGGWGSHSRRGSDGESSRKEEKSRGRERAS